jgi:hypothetical protein
MTAPTVNGTRYPQPVEALLPKARKLTAELGEVPSRNRLMREYRIGAPKAEELRDLLVAERAEALAARDTEQELRRRMADQLGYTPPDERIDDDPAAEPATDPWDHAEPILTDPVDVPLGPAAEPTQTRMSEPTEPTPDPEPQPAPEPGPAAPAAPPAAPPTPADTRPDKPGPAPDDTPEPVPAVEPIAQASTVSHPGTDTPDGRHKRAVVWPVVLLAMPAFVAIWSGWVGLGGLTGFGVVHPLPGIADSVSIDTAITLPIGVETYGAYALYVWLSGRVPDRARRFARWSAIGSLLVGALGQIAYHLLVAAGVTSAPWWITTAVACLPVAVLGMGAALAHLVREDAR